VTFELLASNGFVVYACDHSPSAMVSRGYNHDDIGSFEVYDYALPSHITPSTLSEREHYHLGIDKRVHEIQTLMGHLQTSEVAGRYHSQRERFHLLGHSFGAGTMAAVATRDDRAASCILCKLQVGSAPAWHGVVSTLYISQ
jgi:alpha-beta hydrolase superfamily lysophospholipase